MKRLIYSEAALKDLEGILDYIAVDNPEAAISFAESLISTCKLIAKNPEIGERREDAGSRIRRFTHGAYVIFYRNDEDSVRIQGLVHGARDENRTRFD